MSEKFLINDNVEDEVGKTRDVESISSTDGTTPPPQKTVETKVFSHLKIGQQVRGNTDKLPFVYEELPNDAYRYALHLKKPIDSIVPIGSDAMVDRSLFELSDQQKLPVPKSIRHEPTMRGGAPIDFPQRVESEYAEWLRENGEDDIDPQYRKMEIFLRVFGQPQLSILYKNIFGDKNIEFFQNLAEQEQKDILISVFFHRKKV